MMGSPVDETDRDDDEDHHKVTISKAFYMQTTEVTQEQWKAVMGTEPWKTQEFSKFILEGDNYPATYVSWNNANAFCEKLSAIHQGKTYRLPTEAEWEYACRGGASTKWSFGNEEGLLGEYAWFVKSRPPNVRYSCEEVELKLPNQFGLYDMYGNASEWCNDYYEEDYYERSPEKDPPGPASGSLWVIRGGPAREDSSFNRSADRSWYGIEVRSYLGFRVMRELD
jgi:formylglycine-generating enzyme required for sulfatase activity